MFVFIFVLVGWILSVCFHEFCHAIVAYRGGDTSVKEKGYLTFNPLKYTSPLMTFVLPIAFLLLGGIGFPGGAVRVEHDRLRSRMWRTAMSLAGPGANIVLALLLAFALQVVGHDSLREAIAYLAVLQISVTILNLLPVPPMDGFGAIAPWMAPDVGAGLYRYSNIAIIGLYLLLWSVPAANQAFWDVVWGIGALLKIDPHLAFEGMRSFQFWK